METIKLNNGVEMPAEGLGTFLMQPDEAQAAVESALEQGYCHIDTANAYMNEKAVGRGMRASGVPREDIFLSTKLWPTEYDDAGAAIDATLERLGTNYVDMLILHQPICDYIEAWKAMEHAYNDGKVRSLGLSNFPQEKIQEVIDAAEIKPQLVTVECHPYFQERELREFLEPYGIVIEAWYPLGAGLPRVGGEGRQDPCPDHPALARADGKQHYSRLHESGTHRRQRRHLRLRPHG